MPERSLYHIFTSKLEELNIPYAVTGSVASIFYGEPRMTHDIDIVIHLSTINIARFLNAFPPDQFYVPPEEVIMVELRRQSRGHINVINFYTGFKADLYFTGNDELLKFSIQNAKSITIQNGNIKIAPPEYVIIKKLEFFREGNSQKHIEDIKSILIHSDNLIDFKLLQIWIEKYNFMKEWSLVNE